MHFLTCLHRLKSCTNSPEPTKKLIPWLIAEIHYNICPHSLHQESRKGVAGGQIAVPLPLGKNFGLWRQGCGLTQIWQDGNIAQRDKNCQQNQLILANR